MSISNEHWNNVIDFIEREGDSVEIDSIKKIKEDFDKLNAERIFLARRLGLVESPTWFTGKFNLNEKGEQNALAWLKVAEENT